MARPPTERELAVLTFMIDRASPGGHEPAVTDDDRRRWRDQVRTVRVGSSCGCRTCPSVELLGGRPRSTPGDQRVVLEAGCPGALLLLFIDDDRLSYLELAPVGDGVFPEFPPPQTFRS